MPYTVHKGNESELGRNIPPSHLIPIQEFQDTVVDVFVRQHRKQTRRVAPVVMKPLQDIHEPRRSGNLFRR